MRRPATSKRSKRCADMTRTALALIALSSLTAFAPAPFPKPARRDADAAFSVAQLQGKWKITAFATYDANGRKMESTLVDGVRVEGAVWTFLNLGDTENCKYTLVIG